MAKLGKVARGKRRWLGVAVDDSLTNRLDVIQTMSQYSTLSRARLYDFVSVKSADSEHSHNPVDDLGGPKEPPESTESTESGDSGASGHFLTDRKKSTQQNSEQIEDGDCSEMNLEHGLAIFRLPLPDCVAARDALNQTDSLFSPLTTSGKIRLVRERLGLPIRRRRR
jgi:hypothetical protein